MVIKQYTLQCVCANIYHDINGFKIISQERKKKKKLFHEIKKI